MFCLHCNFRLKWSSESEIDSVIDNLMEESTYRSYFHGLPHIWFSHSLIRNTKVIKKNEGIWSVWHVVCIAQIIDGDVRWFKHTE